MTEYIDRTVLLNHLKNCKGQPPEMCYSFALISEIERFVKSQPAADVAPVVHAKWNIFFEFPGGACWKCSVCGRVIEAHNLQNPILRFPYCHCGAKMESAYIIAGTDLEESK